MANIIIKDDERHIQTNKILNQFGADVKDPAMREAADLIRARQDEFIESAGKKRRQV